MRPGKDTIKDDAMCAMSSRSDTSRICWRYASSTKILFVWITYFPEISLVHRTIGQKRIQHSGMQRMNLDLGIVLDTAETAKIRIVSKSTFGMAYLESDSEVSSHHSALYLQSEERKLAWRYSCAPRGLRSPIWFYFYSAGLASHRRH